MIPWPKPAPALVKESQLIRRISPKNELRRQLHVHWKVVSMDTDDGLSKLIKLLSPMAFQSAGGGKVVRVSKYGGKNTDSSPQRSNSKQTKRFLQSPNFYNLVSSNHDCCNQSTHLRRCFAYLTSLLLSTHHAPPIQMPWSWA